MKIAKTHLSYRRVYSSIFLIKSNLDSPPNRLDGCEIFVEVKTLAAISMTLNARAQKFLFDVEKLVHDLDSKYPGSTFTQRLKSHGKDGRYLVLVVGPFANLSDDFMVLCDLLWTCTRPQNNR